MVSRDDLPPALAAIPAGSVVELDVREDLREGREPFGRIMDARRELPPGGALCVRAIFEPVPLFRVMEKHGLAHHSVQLGPDDWKVWFYPAAADAPGGSEDAGSEDAGSRPAEAPDAEGAGEVGGDDVADDVVVLDVRGLEPPEPMVRTLAALEELPDDGTLVQINVRVPRFLLPQLEERGYAYEIREQSEDLVRVFIRRADGDG